MSYDLATSNAKKYCKNRYEIEVDARSIQYLQYFEAFGIGKSLLTYILFAPMDVPKRV